MFRNLVPACLRDRAHGGRIMIPDILGTGPERANNEPTLSMDHSLNPLFYIAFFYIERSGMNSCHFYMYFIDVRLSLYIYRKTCAAPRTSITLHKVCQE